MNTQELAQRVQNTVRHLPMRGRIRRISLFGSHLHGNPREESDIDLLLEYSDPLSFFELAHIVRSLEESLGKRVDLLTPGAISHFFRDDILREAQPLYEE
jgi:predicted nucleotidyltransferase